MILVGKVVLVKEGPKFRTITVQVQHPWVGNPYEDYVFPDEGKFYKLGDTLDISVSMEGPR